MSRLRWAIVGCLVGGMTTAALVFVSTKSPMATAIFGVVGMLASVVGVLLPFFRWSRRAPRPDPSLLEAEEAREREALRQNRQLRPVSGLEVDAPLELLPDHVYGFADPRTWPIRTLSAAQTARTDLEVQKLGERELYAILFVNQENALYLRGENGPERFMAYPRPWEEGRRITSIPLDVIAEWTSRRFEPRPGVDGSAVTIRLERATGRGPRVPP